MVPSSSVQATVLHDHSNPTLLSYRRVEHASQVVLPSWSIEIADVGWRFESMRGVDGLGSNFAVFLRGEVEKGEGKKGIAV